MPDILREHGHRRPPTGVLNIDDICAAPPSPLCSTAANRLVCAMHLAAGIGMADGSNAEGATAQGTWGLLNICELLILATGSVQARGAEEAHGSAYPHGG